MVVVSVGSFSFGGNIREQVDTHRLDGSTGNVGATFSLRGDNVKGLDLEVYVLVVLGVNIILGTPGIRKTLD